MFYTLIGNATTKTVSCLSCQQKAHILGDIAHDDSDNNGHSLQLIAESYPITTMNANLAGYFWPAVE